MFADTATIEVRAGKGGDGRSSFRHEKYRAMGGPDGGNGGGGGDIIFMVDHNAHTLANYRTTRLIAAEDGQAGGSNRKNGRSGEPAYVRVPAGTQIYDGEELLADLTADGQTAILAKGGRGGFGNAHFQSSTRQAPKAAELGEPGDALTVRLELKLVADVGLIGLPNAGKSTLLSVVTNAKPTIADYAFTTLIPNLGVVEHRAHSFLMADIPGLIEGASEGKGLGDEFLRHVERTAVLLHLIDVRSDDVVRDYETIQAELAHYQTDLTDRPQLVLLTKTDTVDEETVLQQQKLLQAVLNSRELSAKNQAELTLPTEAVDLDSLSEQEREVYEALPSTEEISQATAAQRKVFVISAQAHQGLTPLLDVVLTQVQIAKASREAAALIAEIPVITEVDLPDFWRVETEGDGEFRVTGERIEGFARRTNFNNDEGVERLRDILRKTGVARELRKQGVKSGDTVRIGETELAWL